MLPEDTQGRRRMPEQPFGTARRAWHQVTTTIGAATAQGLADAVRTKGALVGTDEGASCIGAQIDIAAFAVRAHLEHGRLLRARRVQVAGQGVIWNVSVLPITQRNTLRRVGDGVAGVVALGAVAGAGGRRTLH